MSVQKLTTRDCEVHFKDNRCIIMKDGSYITHAVRSSGLYELKTRCAEHAVTNESKLCIHVWHKRLGHRDPSAIAQLCGTLNITACGESPTCESCIQAKMTRKSFPKVSSSRSARVCDLIHTDVCGPMQTITPSGNRYFMTMIDDYSGHTTVYLLKSKSEVPSKIKEYVKYLQTKFGLTPKRIRSDRGGEYMSENLKTFLRDEGIKMELTIPYTPQQNGRAERKNRSLVEMTRSRLADSGLPNLCWGEAITTANHLQNRLPTANDSITPYEKWNDRKPDYSYVRKFGCTAFTVVHDRQKQFAVLSGPPVGSWL